MDNKDNNIEKIKKGIEDTQKAAKSAASAATKLSTGNVAGAVKDIAKNKKLRRKMILNIAMNILAPFLVIVVLAVSILGIFNAVGEAINGIISAIGNFFNFDIKDGYISISDEDVLKIIQSIESMGISLKDLHLLGEYDPNASEERRYWEAQKYIRKFYEAQAVTETPNLFHKKSNSNKTYGAVYIYRYDDSQGDKKRELYFVDYKTMQEYQKNGDETALDRFSIDESGNLVFAGEVKTVKEKGSDKNKLTQDGDTEISIELRIMDYKSLVSQYTTQMNFLVYLTLISQNPEFVSAVVDLIKDCRIEIMIMDNVSIYQEIKTSEYTQHEKSTVTVTVGAGDAKHDEVRHNNTEKDVTEVNKITKTTISPSPQITYVKTWFCEQGISMGGKKTGPTSSTSNPEKIDDEPEPTGDGKWKTDRTDTTETITESTTFQKMSNQAGLTFTLGQRGDSIAYDLKQIPSPTFIGLMEKKFRIPYSLRTEEAGSNLVSGADMLFFLLQKDPKLQNMELIMRYALYLYSGKDYGVTSLDASIFEIKDFKDVGVIEGSAIAEVIRSFENDSLRLYMDGTSSDYNAVEEYVTQDKKQYKMYYTKGDQCLNFSYGIMVRDKEGNLYYTDYFKDEGIDLKSLVAQYDAGQEVKVDVEIIDRIYLKDLNNIKNSLKEIFADKGVSIKEHQIDALVNVSYQYGNCGQTISGDENIVELYKKYYEKGKKEEFKNNAQLLASSGARVHFFLGSTYKDRKEKNWIMFDEGKYILSDGTEIKSGSSVVDFALQFEGENHSRFTNYNPSNGVDDVWVGNEWCAMFVSYCYNENGLIPDVLPKPYKSCGYLKDLYEAGNTRVKIIGDRGYFQGKKKDSYIPSPGDIIFFNWGDANIASHTGIVVDCDGTKVYTIEGNTNSNSWTTSEVSQNEYLLDAACIVGYISING